MAQPVMERRVFSRFGRDTIRQARAILRPGHAVTLVNLSAGGALIDGLRPLRPGSRVFLQILIGDHSGGRTAVIVRSTVASLGGADGVLYRSALRFQEPWEALWEQCTLDGYLVPANSSGPPEVAGHPLPASLPVIVQVTSDGAK